MLYSFCLQFKLPVFTWFVIFNFLGSFAYSWLCYIIINLPLKYAILTYYEWRQIFKMIDPLIWKYTNLIEFFQVLRHNSILILPIFFIPYLKWLIIKRRYFNFCCMAMLLSQSIYGIVLEKFVLFVEITLRYCWPIKLH